MYGYPRGLHILQKISMSLMGVLVLITFVGANLHALLWQSSEWLVSAVLPAVVVQLTNEERSENAAAPLQRNAALDEAAQLKAQHMADNEYFSHFSPDGVSPWYWFKEAGYVYAYAGENLAIHFTDSSEVVEAWMKSPTHRKNIVNGVYTEIGVGTAKGTYEGYDTVYVVQFFGTPAVTPAPASEPVVLAQADTTNQELADVLVAVSEQINELESQLVVDEPTAAEEVLAEQNEVVTEPELALEELSADETVEITIVEEIVAEEVLQETEITLSEEEISPTESTLELTTEEPAEIVVIESSAIATSSGLAIASIDTPVGTELNSGATAAKIATQPNALLQNIYFALGTLVLVLLMVSVVVEARRLHMVQVAYGVFLLVGMSGLWYAHSLLTTGAVIV